MNTQAEKFEAYNEAKKSCIAYNEFKGDKRSSAYKQLRSNVFSVWIGRMDSFGKQLGLHTYEEYFYNNKKQQSGN